MGLKPKGPGRSRRQHDCCSIPIKRTHGIVTSLLLLTASAAADPCGLPAPAAPAPDLSTTAAAVEETIAKLRIDGTWARIFVGCASDRPVTTIEQISRAGQDLMKHHRVVLTIDGNHFTMSATKGADCRPGDAVYTESQKSTKYCGPQVSSRGDFHSAGTGDEFDFNAREIKWASTESGEVFAKLGSYVWRNVNVKRVGDLLMLHYPQDNTAKCRGGETEFYRIPDEG